MIKKKYNIDYINNIKNNIDLTIDSCISEYFQTIISEIKLKYLDLLKLNEKVNDNYYNTNNKSKLNKNYISYRYKNETYYKTDNKLNNKTEINDKNNTNNNNSIPNSKIIYKENINRIKNNNNKSDYDLHIINIRKILNKISDKNYDKLKNELLCYYRNINNEINEKESLNEINIFIFNTLIYNNVFYSKIYNNLLISLIKINSHFTFLINENLDKFINIHKFIYIKDENNIKDSKNYDKYNCFFIFYINLFIYNELEVDYLIKTLNKLHEIIFQKIDEENNIEYIEILNSSILNIISNIYNTTFFLNNINLFDNFYLNVEKIKKMKKNNFKSLSNKTIFINMDIIDKYKLK